MKDVKSRISDKDQIVRRTLTDGKPIDFHQNKPGKIKAKNRMPLPSLTRKSTLLIRLMLKESRLQLLNGAYYSLMHIVKDCLVRLKSKTMMKLITYGP